MSSITSSSVIPGKSGPFTVKSRLNRPVQQTSDSQREPLQSIDDKILVAEAKDGNLLSFDELVMRYRDKALRLVHSVLGARPDAEDIVQDVFIKIYRSLDRFRGDSSFSTYLYTITLNRCRDELRKAKIRRFFSFDDWFSAHSSNEMSVKNGECLESNERVAAVRAAMLRLPPQTSMLLHLREIEEMSYKDLAETFDVEIGTIKSRLARAREKLREELLPFMNE